MIDAQTAKHLSDWADRTLRPEERDDVIGRMLVAVTDDPDLLVHRTWSEIRDSVVYGR